MILHDEEGNEDMHLRTVHLNQGPRFRMIHIDEILQTLISYCEKPTLARLARSCKAVSDPALDELWENLESFAHLLRIFPKELVSWHASETTAAKPVSTTHGLFSPRKRKNEDLNLSL